MPSISIRALREKLPKVYCQPRKGSLYGPLIEVMEELKQMGVLLVVERQPGQPASWVKSLRYALREHAPIPPEGMRWRSSRGETSRQQYVFLDHVSQGRPSEWAEGGIQPRKAAEDEL